MMVSFMRYFKKNNRLIVTTAVNNLFFDYSPSMRFFPVILLAILLCSPFSSLAEEQGHIEIKSCQLKPCDENLCIDIESDIVLGEPVKQALKNGVDLYFVARFLIMQPRWYWFDEEVARAKDRVELSYQALTRQYRLIQQGQSQNFPTLKAALQALGNQQDLPIREHTPLLPDTSYTAVLRIWLDVSRLSKPFQMEWLDTKDWSLSSKRKIWPITFPLVSEAHNELNCP